MPEDSIDHIDFDDLDNKAISQPLVKHMFTGRSVGSCFRWENLYLSITRY
jgi:hypothetical protein